MRQCSSMVDFRVKAEAMVASINSQLHGHYDAMQTVPSVATYVQQAALARQMQMQQAALQTALLERQQVEQPATIPTVSEPTQTNKRAAAPSMIIGDDKGQ